MPSKRYKSHKRRDKSLSRKLLELILLAVLVWFGCIKISAALKRKAVCQLEELTNTQIVTEDVKLGLNASVTVDRLRVYPGRRGADYDNSILKAEKLYANFSIASLFLFKPRLEKIYITDFVVNLQQNTDTGKWNIKKLKMLSPKVRGKMPSVRLKRGSFKYSKVSNGRVSDVASVPLDLRFEPDDKNDDGYFFEITTAKRDGFAEKSILNGFWKPGNIFFTGGLSSANIPSLENAWMVYILAGDLIYDEYDNFSLKLKAKDPVDARKTIENVPEFLKKADMWTYVQKFFYRFNPWGQIDIDLKADGNFNDLKKSRVSGQVVLQEKKEGESSDSDFKLVLAGEVKNFGPELEYDVYIKSDRMALSDELYEMLPERSRKMWTAFSPSGDVGLDCRVIKKPGSDKKEVTTIELLETDAVYHKFPYPLKDLSGRLIFESDKVSVLKVKSADNKFFAAGEITDTRSSKPKYEIFIRAKDIPLDETLEKCFFTSRHQKLFDKIDFSGSIDSSIRILNNPENNKPTFTAHVIPLRAKAGPAGSKKLITDIQGRAVFMPSKIEFKQLEGKSGGGTVELSGWVETGSVSDYTYSLSLKTNDTEMSDDMIKFLPEKLRKLPADLRAGGKISCRANLDKPEPNSEPDYKLDIDCKGVSVNYRKIPYPLNDIRGNISVTEDAVKLSGIKARPAKAVQMTQDPAQIKIDGQVDLTGEEETIAELKVEAENFPLDQNLEIALPGKFQGGYQALSPGGSVDLDFDKLNILRGSDGEKLVDFAAKGKFQSCRLNSSLNISEMNGKINFEGLYKAGSGFEHGRADIQVATLKVMGKEFTELETDFSFDKEKRKWISQKLVAESYGGKVMGRYSFAPGERSYVFNAAFDDIDLKEFLKSKDPNSKNGHSSGKIKGTLAMIGEVGKVDSQTGRCNLIITDMKVGRLSPLTKLLHMFKLNSSDGNHAFDQIVVDSYIKDGYLFFNKFDLSGSDIAFNGKGNVNIKSKEVDIILYARGSRSANSEPSLLESFIDVIGQAVIRVDISGSVDDLQIKTQTLPLFKNTLNILGAGRGF